MAAIIQKKKRNEHMRVLKALKKGENPLTEEEIHFIQTFCHIVKVSDSERGEIHCHEGGE
jgi:hypothetical protein